MPFGLENETFTFSKMMAEMFHGCEHFSVTYLDDVAIYSNSWEEHLNHLNAVLTKIKDAGLTIKPIKCKFAQDRVKYLGDIVGHGIRTPNEVKVKAVLDFPRVDYKKSIAPLTETLKGKLRKGKINWTEECTKAFKELKEKLPQQPALYTPDFNKEFMLQTDASNSVMGVILAQKDNNDK
ncbi:Retrovirus-related Pol polyprotein from transposon 297 [Araneus ventricosus]|uniref:Retrovirus-related Pol polyprotein from transposon 297 n=1 Tax=Araneus ventricosus TaxID=182803 RepID=A0A4Y2VCZ6_ARAVE|nr:Retrovirus-related Pol polyprotein from transposon 297 [Araneus ventricosus]